MSVHIVNADEPQPPRHGFEALSYLQLEILLRAVFYVLQPEQRRFLMREVPAAYDAYTGRVNAEAG